MGDRCSIQFVQKTKGLNDEPVTYKSVVLFNHWGGKSFPVFAEQWLDKHNKRLASSRRKNSSGPITRMDPNQLMIQFIRDISRMEDFDSSHDCESHMFYMSEPHSRPTNPRYFTCSLYLGADENSGDNSDNGHFIIDVPEPMYLPKEKI